MMANLSIINILSNCVADIYIKVRSITSKLHNTSASVAFIKKALFLVLDVISNFAMVKGQFVNETDSLTASHKFMKSRLTKHVEDLYNLSIQYNDLKSLLYSNSGIVLGNTLINIPQRSLSKRRYLSFKTKNQKIVNLIKRKRKPCNTNYSVPIINLSNYNLSSQETQQLKLGLDYCFVDKNKDVRRFLAANMESLADSVKDNIDHKNLKHFHEFLRGYTDIFTNNIYATKDYTYHNLRGMIQNKDIVVVKGDKDSSVVIMKKSDYVTKLDTTIDGSIIKGTYVETTDNMLKKLSQFQDLLYRNFHKYQPARLYGTTKTYKFET